MNTPAPGLLDLLDDALDVAEHAIRSGADDATARVNMALSIWRAVDDIEHGAEPLATTIEACINDDAWRVEWTGDTAAPREE